MSKDRPKVPDDVLRFNAFLADEEKARREKRGIERAEKAKRRAAEEVRRLDADPKASREDRLAAEQRYHEALAAWRRARGEEPDDADADDRPADVEAADADDGPTDDVDADDA